MAVKIVVAGGYEISCLDKSPQDVEDARRGNNWFGGRGDFCCTSASTGRQVCVKGDEIISVSSMVVSPSDDSKEEDEDDSKPIGPNALVSFDLSKLRGHELNLVMKMAGIEKVKDDHSMKNKC